MQIHITPQKALPDNCRVRRLPFMTGVFDQNSGGWFFGPWQPAEVARSCLWCPTIVLQEYCANDKGDCFSDFVHHNAPYKERLQTRNALGRFLAALAVAAMTLAEASSIWLCHIFGIQYRPRNDRFSDRYIMEGEAR